MAARLGVDYIPSIFGDNELNLLKRLADRGELRLGGLGIESLDHRDPVLVSKVAAVAAQLDIPVVMSVGAKTPGSADRPWP